MKQLIAGMILLIAISCKKEYHNYDHYVNNGPVVYPGRPDSALAMAGKARVLLAWPVPSDLNIVNYKVFWNFGSDSVAIAGRKQGTGDSVKVYIDNLLEGSYSFTVHSYDKEGRRSVGTQTFGNVYGEIFHSGIFNRPVRSKIPDAKNARVTIAWVGLDAKCIGTQWNYTATDGSATEFFSPIDDSTIITGCDVTKPVLYRSLFLPEAKAIDTFYTAFKPL